jgi:hypothetical protein
MKKQEILRCAQDDKMAFGGGLNLHYGGTGFQPVQGMAEALRHQK